MAAVAIDLETIKPKPVDDPFDGIGVQMATPSDIGEIVILLELMYAENGLFSLSRKKMTDTVFAAVGRRGGMAGVIRGPERIEGTIGVALAPAAWYSDDYVLGDTWNFVHPDHRRTDHAKKLIKFAQRCAESLDVPLVSGVVSVEQTEAKCRLYARYMPFVGALFMHNMGSKARLSKSPNSVIHTVATTKVR